MKSLPHLQTKGHINESQPKSSICSPIQPGWGAEENTIWLQSVLIEGSFLAMQNTECRKPSVKTKNCFKGRNAWKINEKEGQEYTD